jgi:hypothetical protein
MQGEASPAGNVKSYNGLMARLAAVPKASAAGSPGEPQDLAAVYRRRIITTYFGCGVVASVVLGCAMLLPLLYAHPGTRRSQAAVEATGANLASLPLWQASSTALRDVEVNSFDLPIRRSERASVPFSLEITGAEQADAMRVVLRDVPEAASLSNGQRQDEHTWLLRPADLDNLRLSMREDTPDAFNVTIEVAAATGDAAARSIARVRLLDAPARSEPPAAVPDRLPLRTTGEVADARLAPQSTQLPARARPAEAAPQQKSAPKPLIVQVPKPQLQVAEEVRPTPPRPATRPDGMSALGMASREPELDVRQLWWKMPAPSWAGFTDLPGGN